MSNHTYRVPLNPHIAGLEPYTPIQPLEVLSQRLGLPVADLVKLDANENPYGALPAVRDALAHYPHYHVYPDPQATALREALAVHTGVGAEQILAGHGADELLDVLCRVFLAPGDAVINLPPTFGMYGFDAHLQGARVVEVPRLADFSVDLDAVELAADRAKLLFLTAPNNPTGNWLPDVALERLLKLPLLVVLDEAYVEFAEHASRAGWVDRYDNLVVLRTFSKAAGIAGLRLGYGFFPAWLMPTLWKFKQPYNVNVAALVAGLASLSHVDQIDAVVGKLCAERDRLYGCLAVIDFLDPVAGSQANFILCRVVGRDAGALKQALETRGVLVRYYAKPGLDNCVRISVGRPADTAALMAALRAV